MTSQRQRSSTQRLLGGALAALLVPATIYVAVLLPRFTLSSALLLLLFEVVLVAVTSTMAWSVAVAVVSVLLANWFLVQPHHTFLISNPDDVVVLTVFVLTAVGASLVVTRTQRSREAAARSAFEAQTLRTSVEQPADRADAGAVLERVVTQFGLAWVEIRNPEGVAIASAGDSENTPSADPHHVLDLDEALPDHYRLVGQGPSRLGVDRTLLNSLGTAGLRAWQAHQLSVDAARAEQLAAADRARSALLASVGHDLRTPIAAISISAAAVGSAQMGEPERAELVRTISESADRLDALVSNLLDMSRLEAGSLISNLSPVDVEEVLAEAATEAGSRIVDISVPAGTPDVLADPGLLERVLSNLLSNAIRHSPQDGRVELRARSQEPRAVLIDVVDHGPGLPDPARDDLFAPFQRTGDRSPAGIGLGLAIAHGFTEAMAGTLSAADTPGGGLTMTLTLPRAS